MFRTAIRNCSSYSHRVHVHCADGLTRIFDNCGNVETGPDGNVIAIVGVTHDVTQQVATEAERNNARELHRIMTEAASDIILVYDEQGGLVFASAALKRILGWTEHDIGHHLVHPDDLAEVAKMAENPLPGKRVTATFRMRHADGRYLWLEATFDTFYDEAANKVLYRVGVARDVSDPQLAADRIVAKALSAGSSDNVTVIVLDLRQHTAQLPRRKMEILAVLDRAGE